MVKKSISKNTVQSLLNWFSSTKRDLSFRKDRDPYKVWISEIMAQQTQINTLLPYYERFIKAFPSVKDLAEADIEEVLKNWEGLGYYSRAKNLKKAAEIINKNGFPNNYNELLKLPGIGPYTAGAIASICFNQKVPAVDGNVLRVIARYLGIKEEINKGKTKKEITVILQNCIPDKAGDFNESLMELGALICQNKNPKCLLCPIREDCYAYKNNLTNSLPIRQKKKEKEIIKQVVIIPFNKKEPLYIKRDSDDLLSDLYGFPLMSYINDPKKALDALKEEYNLKETSYIGISSHTFTHKVWKTKVFKAPVQENELNNFFRNPPVVPTAFKKMLNLLIL